MKHKFITIGEIMLRLTPPDYEKIRTATSFEARYGGSEANVALSLANLGVDASFFTVVPGNSLGKSAVRMMRSNDVNCDSVVYSTEEETPTHRLGTYYLETGYGIRPSKVVYDRKHSAFSEYDFSKTDVKKLLEGYTWLHLSGITPALGKSCSELILTCLKTAKANGMTVSFDGNFRSTLWSWEEARDFCTLCLPYVDVLFGIEPYHIWKNEEDHNAGDVKDDIPFQPDRDQQEKVFKAFVKKLALAKEREKDFELYSMIETLAPKVIADERKIYKGVSANVDFYSGFVYSMLDIPLELFTPIFAMARIVGWSAHRLEELTNVDKIIRPAYQSVQDEKEYIEMEDR